MSRPSAPWRPSANSVRLLCAALAAIVSLLAILMMLNALFSSAIHTTSGTVGRVKLTERYLRGSGPIYVTSTLTLVGSDTAYTYARDAFTPTLPGILYAGGHDGSRVWLWYTLDFLPFSHPTVIAMQTADEHGAPGVKYVTATYQDPVGARNVSLALSLGLLALGWISGYVIYRLALASLKRAQTRRRHSHGRRKRRR